MRSRGPALLWMPSWHDIGLEEIAAFEQQRLIAGLGQGVGEAVRQVEASRMVAFAKLKIRFSRSVHRARRSPLKNPARSLRFLGGSRDPVSCRTPRPMFRRN